jgi:hypothetical protein
LKTTHGGARKGAGKKKGTRWPATMAKERARELVREEITKHLEPLIAAQVANAQGLKYLVTRDAKTGKFVRVGEAMARAGSHEETIEVWEKDPSVQAFTDLLNRALDKPKEQEQDVAVRGKLEIVWGQ